MRILIVALSIIVCTTLACKKTNEEPRYTPTQTGKGILYYKVNGVEHICEGSRGFWGDKNVYAHSNHNPDSTKSFTVYGHYNMGQIEYAALYLNIKNTINTKLPLQPQLNKPYKVVSSLFDNPKYIRNVENRAAPYYVATYEYHLDTAKSYVIFTRFDNQIVSGTFYFEANYKDSLYVNSTDGFFDISR